MTFREWLNTQGGLRSISRTQLGTRGRATMNTRLQNATSYISKTSADTARRAQHRDEELAETPRHANELKPI